MHRLVVSEELGIGNFLPGALSLSSPFHWYIKLGWASTRLHCSWSLVSGGGASHEWSRDEGSSTPLEHLPSRILGVGCSHEQHHIGGLSEESKGYDFQGDVHSGTRDLDLDGTALGDLGTIDLDLVGTALGDLVCEIHSREEKCLRPGPSH